MPKLIVMTHPPKPTLFCDSDASKPNEAGTLFSNTIAEFVAAQYEKFLSNGYDLGELDDLAEMALGSAICIVRNTERKPY